MSSGGQELTAEEQAFLGEMGIPHWRTLLRTHPVLSELPGFQTTAWLESAQQGPLFLEVARGLLAGKTAVTDLDKTAWRDDIEEALVHAALGTGLLSGEAACNARTLLAGDIPKGFELETLDHDLILYSGLKRIYAGVRRSDVLSLSSRLWFEGVAGVNAGRPWLANIRIELAYLYALAGLQLLGQSLRRREAATLYAISASPDFAILPGLHFLSLEAIRLRSWNLKQDAGGTLTAQDVRKIYGPEKGRAARELFPSGWDYAFGDSLATDRDILARRASEPSGLAKR
jgi:hypothetical protein